MTPEKLSTDKSRAKQLIESGDRSEMSKVVRKFLGASNAGIIGNWTATPVGKSVGTGTLGICIVRGDAETSDGQHNWSVVGKVMDLSATSEMFAFSSPAREVNVYTSGMLDTLTGTSAPKSRFRSAAYYGLTELTDNLVILWVEDLSHLPDPPWEDDVFATVARHMGHFNGTWLLNPPEHQSWFHEDGYRERFAGWGKRRLGMQKNQGDKYVRLVATEDVIGGYKWLSGNFGRILDYLKTVECPLSHIDAQPKNLFPGVAADGKPETIAIDWATVGYAALGMDAANLLGSSLTWLEIDIERAKRLEPLIFENYLDGLADVGWRGDRDLVRLGYMTVAAGRASGASTFPFTWIGNDEWRIGMEKNIGHSAVDMANHWREVSEWMFPRFKATVERIGIL